MNILMLTNTFTPHIGGVARSVESFSAEFRRQGHRVLVVAPTYENMPEQEVDVVRVPAVQNFNGSDFSVVLPIPGLLSDAIEDFAPDVIHSHHPFLLGGTALRIAYIHELPLVFTHHTMYEQYTHYVPGNSKKLQQFAIKLSTSYANLCNMVFAPSESVAEILKARGVITPIEVVPTGVDCHKFVCGSGAGFRAAMEIPQDAFVIGHLGRLAPEKNLEFLAMAVVEYLHSNKNARLLLIGIGPSEQVVRRIFAAHHLQNRLHIVHALDQPLLASAYKAMDMFVFCSKSETQGMVLTEAMAAGTPVIALDAPGVREVVVNAENGRLLYNDSIKQFVAALQWAFSLPIAKKNGLQQVAIQTAQKFSMQHTAAAALAHYQKVLENGFAGDKEQYSSWQALLRLIRIEWSIIKNVIDAADAAISSKTKAKGRT